MSAKRITAGLIGISVIGLVGYLAYRFLDGNDETRASPGNPDELVRRYAPAPQNYADIAETTPEDFVTTPFDRLAAESSQETSKKLLMALERESIEEGMKAAQQAARSRGNLPTGPGRNVALEVSRPESRADEKSNVLIPNPATGKMEDSRQVFLQSYKPLDVRLDYAPQNALRSSLGAPAGTATARAAAASAAAKAAKGRSASSRSGGK